LFDRNKKEFCDAELVEMMDDNPAGEQLERDQEEPKQTSDDSGSVPPRRSVGSSPWPVMSATDWEKVFSQTRAIHDAASSMADFSDVFGSEVRALLATVNQQVFDSILEDLAIVSAQMRAQIAEIFVPQLNFWTDWAEANQEALQSLSDFTDRLRRETDRALGGAYPVLLRYKWFVTPSMPIRLIHDLAEIGERSGRQDAAVNKLMVDYLERDNWSVLHLMMEGWQANGLFERRHKIFRDCVAVLQLSQSRKVNVANVVLPTLIAQIDGIIGDYLISKGITRSRNNQTNLTKFGQEMSEVFDSDFDGLFSAVMLGVLFGATRVGELPKSPLMFNRNKVLHGENVTYGKKPYMVRAFLLLDFLAHLN
jgi:hypothetical protein